MLQNCDKIMHLHFNFDACPMHSPFRFVRLTESQRTCIILSQFTCKSKYAVIGFIVIATDVFHILPFVSYLESYSNIVVLAAVM